MQAIAKREPTAVATDDLRTYPVDGELDDLADHLREHLAKASLVVHETRIVPSGGEQYLLRRKDDGYEFGLVPRDACPAETVFITLDDGVVTVQGPTHTPRLQLGRLLISIVIGGWFIAAIAGLIGAMAFLVGLVVTGRLYLGGLFGLATAVPTAIGLAVAVLRQRHPSPLRLRQHRQRKVLAHVEKSIRPMLRSALPGVPYR